MSEWLRSCARPHLARAAVIGSASVLVLALIGGGADADQPAAVAPPTISLDTFEYGSPGPSLSTGYIMGLEPQAVAPTYTGSPTPSQGDHSLRLSLFGGSSVYYQENFSLSRTSVKLAEPDGVGAVGLAMRSNGTATHTWHVTATIITSDGKTYTTSDQPFAINSGAWTKHAAPLTTTVPAGSTITAWTLDVSVDEHRAQSGADGGYVYLDA